VAKIRREPHLITAASAAMIRGRAQIEQRVDPIIAVYESAMSTG